VTTLDVATDLIAHLCLTLRISIDCWYVEFRIFSVCWVSLWWVSLWIVLSW